MIVIRSGLRDVSIHVPRAGAGSPSKQLRSLKLAPAPLPVCPRRAGRRIP